MRGLESSALHAEKDGRALGASDAPFCLFQGAEDVLALGFFEGGDRRGWGSRRGKGSKGGGFGARGGG